MWSTHCATIAQPSSSRRAQSWFSGRDKNHFEYLSHRALYPRSLDVPRLPSRLRSCSSFFSRSAASPASRWSAQYLSVVTLLQLGHAQKCADFLAILSPPPPCRIRALLHPAPLFIFVIVLTLFAGGRRVYPLYRFHIHSTQKGSLGEALFFDGTIISCKSCFIVLTLSSYGVKPLALAVGSVKGQCDL